MTAMGELLVHLPDDRPVEPDPVFEARPRLVEAMLDGTPEIWRKPKVIGSLADPDTFSADIDLSSLYDHGEKIVASNGVKLLFSVNADRNAVRYEIPEEFEQLREAIGIIAAHEHANYPDTWRPTPTQARLTVDQSFVLPGQCQRGGGIHRDGYMGRWEHIYLVSSSNPTQFFWTDKPKILKGRGMGLSSRLEPDGLEGPYVPQDYEIVMADTTTPHASPPVEEGGPRTFVRINYEHLLE